MTRACLWACMLAAFLLPGTVRAQCTNLPAGCPTCTMCTYQPVTGTQPSNADLEALMEEVAVDALGDRGPTLPRLESGAARTRGDVRLPCVLFKAIGVVESDWKQFCSTGRTVISFDCGYGISQVTSGVSNYGPRVASEPAFNIGSGVSILIGKWNAETTYGGAINDSNPVVVENWYYATWAYNGFTNGNNPNNPNHPANRPPYGGPGSLSRGSYPYQEIVWGRIRFPPETSGVPRYRAVEVTYPDLADIPPPPSGTSLFEQDITINPQHPDPCGDACANGACPTPSTVIVDNLDPGFSVETGMPMTVDTGGYNGGFAYAPAQAEGSPNVITRFTPNLPSDGTWEVSGWVPLNPANSANIPVEFPALGGVKTFRMDHAVQGGMFQVLGRVKVRAGHTYARVRDDTGQAGKNAGMDAFRWNWVGFGGAVDTGGACTDSTACRDSLACLGGTCVAPCWESPCAGGGACNPQTGTCGPPVTSSSSDASSSASSSSSGAATSGGQVSSSTTAGTSGMASSSGAPSSTGGTSSADTGQPSEPDNPSPFPALPSCTATHGARDGTMPSYVLLLVFLAARSRRRGRAA